MPKLSATRTLLVVSATVWCWSWYTMYLEIFRWKHVTRTLRINTPPPHPIFGQPKPGVPLKVLFVCCGAAPAMFVMMLWRRWIVGQRDRRQRPAGIALLPSVAWPRRRARTHQGVAGRCGVSRLTTRKVRTRSRPRAATAVPIVDRQLKPPSTSFVLPSAPTEGGWGCAWMTSAAALVGVRGGVSPSVRWTRTARIPTA